MSARSNRRQQRRTATRGGVWGASIAWLSTGHATAAQHPAIDRHGSDRLARLATFAAQAVLRVQPQRGANDSRKDRPSMMRAQAFKAMRLSAILITITSSDPVLAGSSGGNFGVLPAWLTPADAHVDVSANFLSLTQGLGVGLGFVLLALTLGAMVAFNLAVWQKLKRVHFQAHTSRHRRHRHS
jgi:hypothetical protein